MKKDCTENMLEKNKAKCYHWLSLGGGFTFTFKSSIYISLFFITFAMSMCYFIII